MRLLFWDLPIHMFKRDEIVEIGGSDSDSFRFGGEDKWIWCG